MLKFESLRNYSNWIVLGYDAAAVIFSWLAAYFIYYNLSLSISPDAVQHAINLLPWLVLVHAVFFRVFSTYRPLWRFSSLPELMRLCKADLSAWASNLIVLFFLGALSHVPRSVWVVYPLVLISIQVLGRLVIRYVSNKTKHQTSEVKKVLIIGAGKGAELFLRDLARWPEKQYQPVAMLDDDIRLKGKEIRGVPILGTTALIAELIDRYHIDLVIIAIPSIKSAAVRKILTQCEKKQVMMRILPSLEEIANGSVSVTELRDISLEDLLGRDPVQLNWKTIEHFLSEEVVLVTGGGGSIGSELCRQILHLNPKKLIIADQSEFNLYQIEAELNECERVNVILLDVTDYAAVEHLMKRYEPTIIFHAAAYKHVPMLESQIRQAVKNNILGTRVLAEAATRHYVKKFVLVSTDKAVNPANVMGATKRIAEMFCQAYNQATAGKTRFVTVRFGNVIGSAGSVIPLFKKQLKKGGPITVTHPDMERYFMTIPEATQLILQAGALGQGGEIFVLDMGQPVKIIELAKQMIRLSGKKEEEIDIQYTGLRPGEKLYEELFYHAEALVPTQQKKIFKANNQACLAWEKVQTFCSAFQSGCAEYDESILAETIRAMLDKEAVMLEMSLL